MDSFKVKVKINWKKKRQTKKHNIYDTEAAVTSQTSNY